VPLYLVCKTLGSSEDRQHAVPLLRQLDLRHVVNCLRPLFEPLKLLVKLLLLRHATGDKADEGRRAATQNAAAALIEALAMNVRRRGTLLTACEWRRRSWGQRRSKGE
jgi:hypothetical protein